jgi:hypothetical protein
MKSKILWSLVIGMMLVVIGACGTDKSAADKQAAEKKEAELAKFMKMAQKASDVNEVENLMARLCRYAESYEYYGDDIVSIMATKTPGVSYKVPMGPVGGEEIKKDFHQRTLTKIPAGQIHEFKLSAPIIEIAGDGKTAKGLWDSWGADLQEAKGEAGWLSLTFGADFIREDGVWKVWHFFVYPKYEVPLAKTFAEAGTKMGIPQGPGVQAKDAKTTWIWDGKSNRPKGVPYIPVPYETFDPATAYE